MRVKKLLALFLALSMLVPALCLAGSADEEYCLERVPGTRQLTCTGNAPVQTTASVTCGCGCPERMAAESCSIHARMA